MKSFAPLRRAGAAILAAAVLWVVFTAANCSTPAGALASLARESELGIALLRRELGAPRRDDRLSPAVTMAISQSPLLLSAREAVWALQQQNEGSGAAASEAEEPRQPVREEPVTPEKSPLPDNGVTARTLIPSGTEGYVVDGLAYITNASVFSLSPGDLAGDFTAALGEGAPQVLIVHTHGSEAYTMPPGEEYEPSAECRTLNDQYNVVRIGDEIAAVLAEHGISTIHDRTLHDYPNYTGAYDRSLLATENYLAAYPSITFVLDIHRDAIYDGDGDHCKLISDEAGGAAQLSLVVGTGGSGLDHPRWKDNLRLASAVQNTILARHPTLMRPIVVRNSRYNQHCTAGSLLVEVGAAGNSLEEALLAARLFARGFAETIQ